MAGMLDEIATYLQGLSLGTIGSDLYKHRLGDAGVPAFATCLFQRPGRAGIVTMEALGVAYEQPDLGVLVRGGSQQYATVMQRAHDIHDALAEVSNQFLSGTWYVAIDPVAPPEDQGVDYHNRPLVLARYTVTKEPSP